MRSGEDAGGLHVALEIPEFFKTHSCHVNNVCAQSDWDVSVCAIAQLRRQRLSKSGQIFIERKQPQQSFGRPAVPPGFAVSLVGRLLIGMDGLGMEVANLEKINGDAPSISSSSPLGVLGVIWSAG